MAEKGKVYLVGAGPGDIGLLTVKGLRCLRKADVVVYDYHINAQILNYLKHDTELIYAGKRGGRHAMTQEQINLSLVDRAQKGKVVCRLKGGDPFVFGRGGEEAELLARAGIEFEVIPGVSSATAVPAYAGIPLTHRDYASAFTVVTGNEAATKPESALDWPGLARSGQTLVFLMGVKNIEAISRRLIEYGRPAETPAALVRWGSRPDQKTVTGTLETISHLAHDAQIRPPAIMVVGEVVNLRSLLAWYERKPLFGHRILITREYTADYEPLEDLGGEIFEFPTMRTTPPQSYGELDEAIGRVNSYDWLIFTSSNGFHYFTQRFLGLGRDIRELKGIRLCAIGSKTAETISQCGMKVDLVPEEFSAEGLVDAFARLSGNTPGAGLKGLNLLLPRAEAARELFPERVRALGGRIDTPVAYRSVKPVRHAKRLKRFLLEGRISIATFTSSTTFTNFIYIMGEDALPFLKRLTIAAIGPVTKKAVENGGLKVTIVPEESTISAMVEAIIEWATKGG